MDFVKLILSQHFFWYFIPEYLMNCCSGPYKTCHILKEDNKVFQMDINRFRFLAEVNTNLQKMHYLGNLRSVTQEQDQNFFPLNSGNIHIQESKNLGFTFSIKLRTKFVWSHGPRGFPNNKSFLVLGRNLWSSNDYYTILWMKVSFECCHGNRDSLSKSFFLFVFLILTIY